MRRPESTFFLTSCPQRPEKGLELQLEPVKVKLNTPAVRREVVGNGGLVILACPLGSLGSLGTASPGQGQEISEDQRHFNSQRPTQTINTAQRARRQPEDLKGQHGDEDEEQEDEDEGQRSALQMFA
uniref:HDC00754 n=1 Tax=Drosophila melanogaster TaxID=7227 RepID=Q6IHW1_DROME|nr:TPA_inf: HDC00754 [Drosophila melanogaster]